MQNTKKQIPADVQEAINAIWLWVQEGCPYESLFFIGSGICGNVDNYFTYNLKKYVDCTSLLFDGNLYPFNDSGDEYMDERNCYTNPQRLAWLNEHRTI